MDVKVTYLEMLACTPRIVPPPREGLLVLHASRPTIRYYRFLYDAVGRPWQWLSRRKLSDEELAAMLNDPRDEVHVLHVAGVPAGFAELDRRAEREIECCRQTGRRRSADLDVGYAVTRIDGHLRGTYIGNIEAG